MERVAIDLPRVRRAGGQDVEPPITAEIEPQRDYVPSDDGVQIAVCTVDRLPESSQAVWMRVERLLIVVTVGSALHCAESKTATGERCPQRALVIATGQSHIRSDDRVTARYEARSATLQLESIDHELVGEVVATGLPALVDVIDRKERTDGTRSR